MSLVPYVLTAVAAYLLGSIPTGYLVARTHWNVDLLRQGSRRTGTTNVLRTLGWKAAALVFAGDYSKGIAAVVAARVLTGSDPWADVLAGVMAIAGHTYSLFLGFKGGRGVVTGLGAFGAMAPVVMLLVAIAAFSTIGLSRYVSLGSLVGSFTAPVLAAVFAVQFGQPWPHALYALAAGAFVVINHRDNITRLLNGTERKLGQRVNA